MHNQQSSGKLTPSASLKMFLEGSDLCHDHTIEQAMELEEMDQEDEEMDQEDSEPYPVVQAKLAQLGVDTRALKEKVFRLIKQTDDLDTQVSNLMNQAARIHGEVVDEVADLGK